MQAMRERPRGPKGLAPSWGAFATQGDVLPTKGGAMSGRMGTVGAALALWNLALVQAGPPWGIPAPRGARMGGLYQSPMLGKEFPLPKGFRLAAEAPYEGSLGAVFTDQGGAELYAVSRSLSQLLDLQAFPPLNLTPPGSGPISSSCDLAKRQSPCVRCTLKEVQ